MLFTELLSNARFVYFEYDVNTGCKHAVDFNTDFVNFGTLS